MTSATRSIAALSPPLAVRQPLLFALLALMMQTAASAQATLVPYQRCFMRSASEHKLPAVLLQAVAATESNFNPNARSHANAHGLMQIQWPGTARHLGVRRVAQLYKPCKNIDLGARYLRELFNKYDNDERRALAAYNYGPGRIAATGAIPNGAQNYVNKVRVQRMRLLGGAKTTTPISLQANSRAPDKKPRKKPGKQQVASFSTRLRAERYARLLGDKVPGANFIVQGAKFGRHGVMLTSATSLLSADERVLLSSLGWRPAP